MPTIPSSATRLRPRALQRAAATSIRSAQRTFAPPSSKPRAIAPSIPAGRSSTVPSQRSGIERRRRDGLVALDDDVELEVGQLLDEPRPSTG